MPSLILGAADPRNAGAAVGLNALMRSIGTSTAAAAIGTVLSQTATVTNGVSIPSAGSFQIALALGIGAALVGVALVLCLPASPIPRATRARA